jgi:structural maintenance of chromosome 1
VIQEAETRVFADFCRKIRISNIREYERSTVKSMQEAAEKKLQLAKAKSKLEEL